MTEKVKTIWHQSEARELQRKTERAAAALRSAKDIIDGTSPKRQNLYRLLNECRQVIAALTEGFIAQQELVKSLSRQSLEEAVNSNKPWGAEEDEFLVDRRADGVSMFAIANGLGRTPAACATRLSTLTGIPRSDVVELYLDGKLEGEHVRGLYSGRTKRVTR